MTHRPSEARTRWRRLAWLSAGGVLLMLGVLSAPLVLAVDALPQVRRPPVLRADTLARMRALAQAELQGQRVAGQRYQVPLPAADLDGLAHDSAARLLKGAARLELTDGRARLFLSLPVREGPQARLAPVRLLAMAGSWLNVELVWRQTEHGLPELERARVGSLGLPPTMLSWLLDHEAARLGLEGALSVVRQLPDAVRLQPGGVVLSYHWQAHWRDEVRALMVPPAERERLLRHALTLDTLLRALPPGGAPVSLSVLLGPMFESASARTLGAAALGSEAQPLLAQATAEARSALLVLIAHVTRQPLARLVPGAAWPELPQRSVQLLGREDYAQHFLVSALLAAESGGSLANLLGLYKELADTRGGSGFSFNDLAADRAGARLGRRLARDPLGVQQRLAAGVTEQDLLPRMDDLPEFLSTEQFRERYGGIGTPRYDAMLAEIDARLQRLELLR